MARLIRGKVPGTVYLDDDGEEYLYLGYLHIFFSMSIAFDDGRPGRSGRPELEREGTKHPCHYYVKVTDELKSKAEESEDLGDFIDKLIRMNAVDCYFFEKNVRIRTYPCMFLERRDTWFVDMRIEDHVLEGDARHGKGITGHPLCRIAEARP